MNIRVLLFSMLVPMMLWAQPSLPGADGRAGVWIKIGNEWAELHASQTQSELRPGWKIVDYQMKSRLIHYLTGSRAHQVSDGARPVLCVVPHPEEVLVDYAIIRLKRHRDYRKIPKASLLDNTYIRLEPKEFDISGYGEAFVCQPRQPLEAGEYVLVCLSQRPIGDLGDLLVFPFSVL